jgi:hypothetical protein
VGQECPRLPVLLWLCRSFIVRNGYQANCFMFMMFVVCVSRGSGAVPFVRTTY